MQEISLEATATGGRYFIADGSDDEAEMTFSRASATLVIVDHTHVPDRCRGQGVGLRLAERVIADARAKGFRILPLCPFMRAQFAKHPEWHDVLSQ